MILGRVLKSLDLTELFVSSVYVGLVNLFRNHRLRRRAGHCRMAHSVDPEIRRVLTKGERLVERQYGGGALSCTSALPPFAALVYTSLFRSILLVLDERPCWFMLSYFTENERIRSWPSLK